MGGDLHAHWALNAALTLSDDHQAAASLPHVATGTPTALLDNGVFSEFTIIINVVGGQYCHIDIQTPSVCLLLSVLFVFEVHFYLKS